MSRTKNSIKNIVSGLSSKIIAIPLQFILRAIIINKLGSDYLGLNSFMTSLLNMINIAELGFGSAMVYLLYKPIAENNFDRIGKILNYYRRVYRIIGIVILIGGMALLPFLNFLSKGSCPAGVNIYLVYLIYLFDTVISYFCYAYKLALVSAYQRRYITTTSYLVTHTLMCVIQIAVLFIFESFYIYVFLIPVFTLIKMMTINAWSNRVIPKVSCTGDISIIEKRGIKSNVAALFVHKIGDVVIYSADNIFVSAMLGLQALGVFNNYMYIITSLSSMVDVFGLSILGSVGNLVCEETEEESYSVFKQLELLCGILIGWSTIILCSLYQNFMYLWVGKDYMYEQKGVIILFSLYFFVLKNRLIIVSYKDAAGLWKDDRLKPCIGIVLNLILNYILVYYLGVKGVLISTICIIAGLYLPWEVRLIFKKIFKRSSKEYYLNLFIRIVATLAAFFATQLLLSIVPASSVVTFLVRLFVSVIIPGTVYYLFYRKTNEWNKCILRIKNIVRKK